MSVIEEEKEVEVPLAPPVVPAKSAAQAIREARLKPAQDAVSDMADAVRRFTGGYVDTKTRAWLIAKTLIVSEKVKQVTEDSVAYAEVAEELQDIAYAELHELRDVKRVNDALNEAIAKMGADMAAMGERLQAQARRGIIGALVRRASEGE